MRLGVSREKIHSAADTGMETRIKGDPAVRGDATIFLPRVKSGFDEFILGLSVDSEESALQHFQSKYLGVYLNLKNESSGPLQFQLSQLVLKTEYENIASVPFDQLPAELNRVNWKGNMKNAYNAAVVTVGTVAIIASVLYCLKEGECGAMIRAADTAINLTAAHLDRSTAATEERGEMFSSVTHNTELIYENLLPASAVIPPGGNLEGLVFFPRPEKFSIARVFWNKDGTVRDEEDAAPEDP